MNEPSHSTDIPVTQKFMQDMDEHLSGKAKANPDNIFTILMGIPVEKKIDNIEELENKNLEDFPIKVLMAPHLLEFFTNFQIPNTKEYVPYKMIILS